MLKIVIGLFVGAALWCGGGMLMRHTALPLLQADPPAVATSGSEPQDAGFQQIICSGRVEPVNGEVEVSAQIAGRIVEMRVNDGDAVQKGQILAVMEGARQAADLGVAAADVEVARSKLQQLVAGPGKEEIDQALFDVRSVDAQLVYETTNLERSSRLSQAKAESADDYQRKLQRVQQLQHQRDSLNKRYEALRRGALPEEIEVARAHLALAEAHLERAKVENGYRLILAPMSGTILEVYRHAGDSTLTTDQPMPLLRIADTSELRVRLEVDEANVPHLQTDLEGTFTVHGDSASAGRLAVKTIIPVFGPKRLFNPDTSARFDTRTLAVLCKSLESRVPMYAGQRITAHFAMNPQAAHPNRDTNALSRR
jgi:multidrug efflux pump subunit AcrA (membrane-fusion protein)